jgi:hypothetical protein
LERALAIRGKMTSFRRSGAGAPGSSLVGSTLNPRHLRELGTDLPDRSDQDCLMYQPSVELT